MGRGNSTGRFCFGSPLRRRSRRISASGVSIVGHLDFYNRKRLHSGLDARRPDRAYFDELPLVTAA